MLGTKLSFIRLETNRLEINVDVKISYMIQLGQGNRKAGVVATSLYMKGGGVI